MDWHYMALSLPWVILYGLIPGFTGMTLVVPHWKWWHRLAAAPGASCGLIGLIGLLEHLLHLPFEPLTIVPVLAVIAGLGAWRQYRYIGPREATPWLTLAGAVFAGIVFVLMPLWAFRDLPVPVNRDTAVHATVASAIAHTHEIDPAISEPVTGSAWVRPRDAVEAESALIEQSGGPSAPYNLGAIVLLAVLLLPLALVTLIEVTGFATVVLPLVALVCVGWAFPQIALNYGEFPYIVDATLIAPLVGAIIQHLRGNNSRSHLVLISMIVAWMWTIHGLEILTTLLILAPLFFATFRQSKFYDIVKLSAAATGAAIASAVVTTLLINAATPSVRPAITIGSGISMSSGFEQSIGSQGLDYLLWLLYFSAPSLLCVALFAAGAAHGLVARKNRWVIALFALTALVIADVTTLGVLRSLVTDVWPWTAVDRVIGLLFWSGPILVAFGILFVTNAPGIKKPLRVCLQIGLVATVLLVGINKDFSYYTAAASGNVIVTTADDRLFQQMNKLIPAGSVVFTHGNVDAGQWIGAYTQAVPYYSDAFIQDHQDGDATLQAVDRACADPTFAATALSAIKVRYLFMGSTQLNDIDHPWNLQCIAKIPGLKVLARSTAASKTSVLFAISPDH